MTYCIGVMLEEGMIFASDSRTNAGMDSNVFTLGFARRATPYKRAALLLTDVARLKTIAAKVGRLQVIYGGKAHLFVTGPAAEAKALAEKLPSSTSRDYGRPFAEVFKTYKGDFYAIDPMLFSPACAIVTAVETGETKDDLIEIKSGLNSGDQVVTRNAAKLTQNGQRIPIAPGVHNA